MKTPIRQLCRRVWVRSGFPGFGGFAASKPAVCALVMALALGRVPARASAVLPASAERSAPLIMENADKFEGYRSRGEYVLSGKVRFRHGELRVETERAVWQKDRNIIFCESGMRLTRNGSLLTADRGTYDKNLGQATAQGNVFIRDSSGEVTATGQSIVYMRFRHLATLTGDPEVRRFYREKDSLNAGAAKADSAPDTLSIKGEIMTYDDSLRVAIADGNVRIHREQLYITCKKAEYHDPEDSLYLLGQPQMVMEDNRIKGDIMRLGMHGEEIKSLLVKGAAQAHSIEPATDTSVARQSDVHGDSLFLVFKEKTIDSVQVFRNADGAYFDVDKPEFVNKMSGEYMVLRFNGKQVASANVLGGVNNAAKSTYFHFEKQRLKGKNDAQGDTIDFAFKNGKVDEVMVRGAAKGTYFGEKPPKPGNVPGDSLKVGPDAKAKSEANGDGGPEGRTDGRIDAAAPAAEGGGTGPAGRAVPKVAPASPRPNANPDTAKPRPPGAWPTPSWRAK